MKKVGALLLACCLNGTAQADFTLNNVKVTGNKRISFETIRSYLAVEKGTPISTQSSQQIIESLYDTGFFKTIDLYELPDQSLLIQVVERPSIAEISYEGNELIKEEDMELALDGLGIRRGRIFNRTQMDRVILELRRRYQNEGYYAAEIKIEVEELPRNRVALNIQVEEGEAAGIGRISFVGNETYDDARLKSQMLLSDSAAFDSANQYAKPKLQADLEIIKSFYMDRGFAEFEIVSSQVSLSLDKTQVYITVNMQEGPQYSVRTVKFSGETILDSTELHDLLKLEDKDLFSRTAVIQTMDSVKERLSEEGYAFAEVNPLTQLDKTQRLVDIDFRVEPRDRVYVRRILIEGNTRTHDDVIRREVRQLEAAPYSLAAVRRSNTRLNRLGYFQTVNIDTRRIAKDEVDLVIKVTEQMTGSFNAGVSYSQLDEIGFTTGITERNVLGTGYRANLTAKYSSAQQTADLSVTNPYFTEEGVSLGGGFYLNKINASELNISDYVINNLGVRLNLGYPISEIISINYGLKLDRQHLVCEDSTFTVCTDHVSEFGSINQSTQLTLGWTRDTKNAFYFPSAGQVTSISGELHTPINNEQLYFYKLYVRETVYLPLTDLFTFKWKGDFSYSEMLNNQVDQVPFYENFFAGGIGSVRGYEPNSLGGRYDGSTRAKGGPVKLISSAEMVFPMPFIEDSSNLRLSLFLDAGMVSPSLEAVNRDDLRSAYGFGLSWITPVGPLAFSFARAINPTKEDEPQFFQFSLGMPM